MTVSFIVALVACGAFAAALFAMAAADRPTLSDQDVR